MLPTEQLMSEHRLIERMVTLLNHEFSRVQATKQVDLGFIEIAVDFFRVYTDFCHHGKEEHILFGELEAKPLLPEHRAMMDELIYEHIFVRRVLKELLEAKGRYEREDNKAFSDITRTMSTLSTFYPAHIEKEDKHFFPISIEYLSEDERSHMFEAFYKFDSSLIHELYNEKVLMLEQKQK
ncbi:MAG: hemerythrin domain-containing protein [Actinomycetota bacterium]|nr:hemerythrin domain-containing protein [Actinomycetota bacterium]